MDYDLFRLIGHNFKSVREEKNVRKVAKSFLTTPDELEELVQSNFSGNYMHQYNVAILNIFDSELQLINTKPNY